MISEISKPTVEDYISEMIFVGNISSESFLKTFNVYLEFRENPNIIQTNSYLTVNVYHN